MVNAEIIAKALGGRKASGSWIARCPSHDDRKPSLSISDSHDGKVLVRCHARCEQEQVIAALRSRGLVGEGIETCLAAMLATGQPAWAALSTSGLGALDLPRDVRDVIVLADGDEAGEAAARDCARRWKREGRWVRIARPPHGLDFNDVLVGRAPGIGEGA